MEASLEYKDYTGFQIIPNNGLQNHCISYKKKKNTGKRNNIKDVNKLPQ